MQKGGVPEADVKVKNKAKRPDLKAISKASQCRCDTSSFQGLSFKSYWLNGKICLYFSFDEFFFIAPCKNDIIFPPFDKSVDIYWLDWRTYFFDVICPNVFSKLKHLQMMEKNEVLYPEKRIGSLPGWLCELMSVLLFLCWC